MTDDNEFIRNVIRKMLMRVDEVLDAPVPQNDDQAKYYYRVHELTFGTKATLADTLTSLTELWVNLSAKNETPSETPLTNADIAMIEAYFQKQKIPQPVTGDLFS
jgi:hypothetical protein